MSYFIERNKKIRHNLHFRNKPNAGRFILVMTW